MKEKREFTGVFIPAKIWVDQGMCPAEKMLLGEVKALSEKTGWCAANNQHFAEWLHCSKQNVSMYISGLVKSGRLEVDYSDQKTFAGRRMRVNTEWYHGLQPDSTPLSLVEGGLSQAEPPLSQVETEIQYKHKESTAASEKDAAYTFAEFWQDYGYKRGSKAKACARFGKLTGRDREAIREALPHYLRATITKDTGDRKGGFKPMRKYPEFFLSGRVWESLKDEISEEQERDAVTTPHDDEYKNYLEWVKNKYPRLLHSAKHMSKTEFVNYRTEYYVQGKSKLGERMEREYMVRAHDDMDTNQTTLEKYTDVFALHCERVQEFVKLHTV